ncbi:phosphopantetheine-binding protein [Buchnera aphidicola (Ceratovacuna keduensis)]|uniref:phosphopantetheine-binding protein n=1 Tax=Buchnera aphidicola TaxID=9 RepID=UPI0031B81A23
MKILRKKMKKIKNIIKNIISKQFKINIKKIKNNFSLEKNYDIDSLEKIEFIMRLEEKFDIKIKDKEIEKLQTITDIEKYIIKKNKIKKKLL